MINITRKDIEKMITECVGAILNESQHVLDDGIYNLSVEILKFALANREYNDVEVDREDIERYLPKRYLDRMQGDNMFTKRGTLHIIFKDNDMSGSDGLYEFLTNTIYLRKIVPDLSKLDQTQFKKVVRKMLVALFHEMSHFVDNNMQKRAIHTPQWEKNPFPVVVSKCLYYFDPTEIQARLNQYNISLKLYPKMRNEDITTTGQSMTERTLGLNEMESLIFIIENLNYNDEMVNNTHSDNPMTSWIIVYLDYMKRFAGMQRRRYSDKNSQYKSYEYVRYLKEKMPVENVKPLDRLHFDRAKEYFLNDYRKKYKKMYHKAQKIHAKWLHLESPVQ